MRCGDLLLPLLLLSAEGADAPNLSRRKYRGPHARLFYFLFLVVVDVSSR